MANRQPHGARVPLELAEAAASGDLVPVIGDWLTGGHPAGLPTPQQLANALAQRMKMSQGADPKSRDLPVLASQYEASAGTHALVSWIQNQWGTSTPPIPDELRLAVKLSTDALITTSVSLANESALNSQKIHGFSVLVDPLNAAYTSKAQTPWLIKLAGCVSRPDSLVVSQDRIMWMSTAMDNLAILIKGILLTRTLTFVGYRLDDPHLEMVHTLLQTDARHAKRRYIILDSEDPSIEQRASIWENRGYELVQGPTKAVLHMMVDQVNPVGRSLRRGEKTGRERPAKPFKFLDYFTEDDVDDFFGRDDESEQLTATVTTCRFTLVLGASGVGKTSLVNAGLIPRLHTRGFDTYSVRALQHPATEIINELTSGDPPIPGQTDLYSELKRALDGRPAVLIIDQFEEFFIRVGAESRAEFAQELHRCIDGTDFDLRIVVVIREDFLHYLLEMQPPIEHVFKNHYWVRPFSRRQLQDFLTSTARHFGIEMDEALGDQLLEDLDDHGIDPAHLQIVCHTLYQGAAGGPGRLTVSDYRQLGATHGILSQYLEYALENLSDEKHALAKAVLKCMVSADQTKTAMTAMEIARDSLMMRLETTEESLLDVLQELVRIRVVRPIPGREDVFELAHDVLARKIWKWIEPAEVELKYIRQILRQCVTDWERMKILPGRAQWSAIDRHRESLTLTREEARMALRASLTWDERLGPWLEKASDAGLDLWAEFRDVLRREGPEAKLTVLNWIAETTDERATELLELSHKSEYPAIRRTARRLLDRDRPPPPNSPNQRLKDLFVTIDAGEFTFGTDDSRFEHSGPAHVVYLSAFALQVYPVTNYEYWQYVKESGGSPPDFWQGPAPPDRLFEHPVTQVSWFDACAYCEWYRGKFDLPVRLPTGAEWEKAAGWDPVSSTKRLWSWGDEYDARKGNSRSGGPGHTTPIGQYSPTGGDSPYGASDMCGNTFDWVQDWWLARYDVTQNRDPRGAESGQHKSARGGSWAGSAEGISAVSNKYSLAPGTRNEYTGFRIACTLPAFEVTRRSDDHVRVGAENDNLH